MGREISKRTGSWPPASGHSSGKWSGPWAGMAAVLLVALGCGVAGAQSASQPPAPTPDANQFPDDTPKPAAPKPAAGQTPAKPDPAKPATPAAGNAFPGEDANVPIIPVDGAPVEGTPAGDSGSAGNGRGSEAASAAEQHRGDDPDGDPVRSPDGPGGAFDDGFSSSRAGLGNLPMEDVSDGKPGKSVKNKTREQILAEDVDVGNFYLEKKNWKAAQLRFAAAFALDRENADAVWGLAEAERHLQMNVQAAEHYRLFLSYDPEGPHGKAARKGLEQAEAAGNVGTMKPK